MKFPLIVTSALIVSSTCWAAGKASDPNVSIPDAAVAASSGAPAHPLTAAEAREHNIPCPAFWTVQPNPSVENSLSYVHESGDLAISVTYISDKSGETVTPAAFSRVAAEQMSCTMPVKSNLLKNAWAFNCDNNIEALVYGETGKLVLLGISGRNEETESLLDNFISFLDYQSLR